MHANDSDTCLVTCASERGFQGSAALYECTDKGTWTGPPLICRGTLPSTLLAGHVPTAATRLPMVSWRAMMRPRVSRSFPGPRNICLPLMCAWMLLFFLARLLVPLPFLVIHCHLNSIARSLLLPQTSSPRYSRHAPMGSRSLRTCQAVARGSSVRHPFDCRLGSNLDCLPGYL